MYLVFLVNVLFAGVNLKWSREAFLDGRPRWGWIHLLTSAWCAAVALLDIL